MSSKESLVTIFSDASSVQITLAGVSKLHNHNLQKMPPIYALISTNLCMEFWNSYKVLTHLAFLTMLVRSEHSGNKISNGFPSG